MNLYTLAKSKINNATFICFLLFTLSLSNSYGQSFNWHFNSNAGEIWGVDRDNNSSSEDFIWIVDQNSWTNGSNTEKMRLGASSLKLNVPIHLNDNALYLRSDDFHVLRYCGSVSTFAGVNLDGPVLYGTNGGGLGSNFLGNNKITIRWNSDGNVGIGTATPGAKLDIMGNARMNSNDIYLSGGNDINHGLGYYGNTKLFANTSVDGPVLYGWTSGALGTTGGGAQKISLFWNNLGNVGIGTASPTTKLDVNGGFKLQNATSSILWSNRADSDFDLIQSDNSTRRAFTIHAGNTGANVVEIYSKQSNQYQPALFVTNGAGNVGIGTGVPSAKLHVKGTMRLDSAFSMAATPTFSIDSASVAGGRFLVNTDGRVGIGVPAAKLEDNCKLSINGPTYIGDFGAGYNSGFIRDSLLSSYLLWVEKGIVSEDFAIAEVTAWDDYVFNEDYQLPSLAEIDAFIKANKHLPNIPSEAEVKKDGYSLHKLNRGLLKTIEEQTLHAIAQEKKISTLENKVNELESALNQYQQLAAEVAALKAIMLENVSKK